MDLACNKLEYDTCLVLLQYDTCLVLLQYDTCLVLLQYDTCLVLLQHCGITAAINIIQLTVCQVVCLC